MRKRPPMTDTASSICCSVLVPILAVVLSVGPPRMVYAQEVGFIFASNSDDRTQAFAGRGLAIDIMSDITYIGLEETDRTVEIFKEVAPDVLVRTYDSLQPGTSLRGQVDRLLAISGDRLESIDFVLIDDEGGLRPEDVEGVTTIAEGGKHLVWPSTNISGGLFETSTTYESLDEPDTTLTIESVAETDPDKRAEDLNWEADFLDETADLLEALAKDASGQLGAIRGSIGKAAGTAANKEAILASLNVQLEAMSDAHEAVARLHDANQLSNLSLEIARQMSAARGLALPLPNLPTFEDELAHQMDELTRLIRETDAAEANLEPAAKRLKTLQARQRQLASEIERWSRDAKENRQRAEILRRRASGLLSGELNLADYRREVTTVTDGWTYEADVVVGSTLAQRFVTTFEDWGAWEGIILHRVVNSQLLSAGLIAGRMNEPEPEEMPLFKAGWSEVAFLGARFDEADLSTLPHQAFETGVGIFLSGRRSEAFRNQFDAFFDKTGPKYVFPKDRTLTSGIPKELAGRYVGGFADFGTLEGPADNQMPYATGSVEVGKLAWEDVPADYLLRSSATVAGFLHMVAAGWSDGSVVTEPIFEFLSDTWDDVIDRDLPALARHLSVALERSASEWSMGDRNVPGAAGLMPLAYLDVHTNFGLSQLDVYPVSSDGEPKPSMFDQYWSRIRSGLRIGLDRSGLFLGASNMDTITETTDKYLVCAVKFVGDQGSESPEELVDTCWPEVQDGK